MTTQAALFGVSGGLAVLTAVAGVAERRRAGRRNLDAPGWVPWTTIQIVSIFAAFVAAALAIRS